MKNNLWIALAFVLLSANLLLLTFYLLKDKDRHPPHPHKGWAHDRHMAEFISDRLHLDPQQRLRLQEFIQQRRERDEIRDSLDLLKNLLFINGAYGLLQNNERDSLLHQIGTMHVRLDLVTLQYFQYIRELCNNPQQKKEFDSFVEELVRRTLRRGPPPPPHNHFPFQED